MNSQFTLGYFANTLATKVAFKFNLDPKQFRHGFVLGKTGVGKSTLLKHIIAAAAQLGWGILVEDPHGDLADDSFNYIPWSRIDDVMLLDPENDHIPGIGLLDHPNKDRALRMAMTFYEAHSGDGWGKQTATFFRAFTRASLELFDHPTIIEVWNLMSDYAYAKVMLAKSKNPRTLKFHQQYLVRMKEKDFVEKCSHPLNKLEELIEPGIVEFLGQPNSLNFRKLMDDSKIVICRLPKSFLEERGTQILGSLIMMKFKVEAARRKNRNKPFLIIADEFHNFTMGIDVSTLFGESRKYGLHIIPASQTREQLGRNADIIMGNASHIFAFRMNANDAEVITENLGDDAIDKNKLVKIANYKFRALTMSQDEPQATEAVSLLAKPQLYRNLVPARKAHARASQNTGAPVAEVRKDIEKRLSYSA